MKKLLISVILIASSFILDAQDYNTTIGIKIYPGITTLYDHFIEDENYSTFSLSKGLEIRQRLIKNLIFIETGFYIFERGFKIDYNITDDTGVFIRKARSREIQNYFTIPFSIILQHKKFYSGVGGNVNFYMSKRWFFDGKLISTQKLPWQKERLLGVQLFVGYEFRFNSNIFPSIELFASPTFDETFLNYGIGLGFKYAFTR